MALVVFSSSRYGATSSHRSLDQRRLLYALNQVLYELTYHFNLVWLIVPQVRGRARVDVLVSVAAVVLEGGGVVVSCNHLHILYLNEIIEFIGNRFPVFCDKIDNAELEFLEVFDDGLRRLVSFGWHQHQRNLRHLSTVPHHRKVLNDLIEVHNRPIAEESVLF